MKIQNKINSFFAGVCLIVASEKQFAQVGVNIVSPHSSAALQVESPAGTAKGLLTPSMTTTQRMSMSSGTNIPADGLIVFDKDHRMHYYFQAAFNRWVSMSPLTLSTPLSGSFNYSYGYITTPASPATFSLGINQLSPSQELDVSGSARISGNFEVGGSSTTNGTLSAASLDINGYPANALVPAGVIVLWSGAVVPKGWALCDGGVYGGIQTPDLRGRFVVGMNNTPGVQQGGTGAYLVVGATGQSPANAPADGTTVNYGAIGNTGGENGHTLSLAEMPSHTHSVTVSLNNANMLGFNNPNTAYVWLGSPGFYKGQPETVGVSYSEQSRGSDQIHENRPPYYVLAYIIKLP